MLLLAVIYNVLRPAPPQATFEALSGVKITPRGLPSDENIQTPPGPVLYTFPV